MRILNCIKTNEIVNKLLLAGDKFMPEMHLKKPGFTYSACGPFTKNKDCSGYHYCTASLTKPKLRFCADSNPARSVSEIHDGEDL